MGKSRRASIDAMLRHLASHHDPQDFPSTAYERQALIEAAGKRRLVEWQKDGRRYELTARGWRRLRRNRGLGLPALAVGAGVGAAIGAAALAMLWLPTDRSAGGPAALGPPVENVGPLNAASLPPGSSTPDTAPAAAPATAASTVPHAPAGPVTVAEPSGATQPDAEPATPAAKEPAAKKSRHRTARSLGRQNWTFGRRYRDERFAGTGRP
jgi:hypothetical protein